jgi:outer membrane protein assembly factor BamB
LVIRGSYCTYAVFALNGTTGEKVWETFLPTDTGYAGCYANGRVYVGCLSVAETCLNSTTGEIIWRNTDGYANRAFNVWNVGYAYGRVYYHDLGSGRTGATKCYDALTGQKLWASTSLFSIAYYVFKIADGKVYGRQSDGSTTTGRQADPVNFCCWDAFTGEIIWNLKQSIACPVIAYGSLYFVQSNVLVCISTAYPPEGWTMWRGNAEFPGITLDDAPRDFSMGPVWTYQTGGPILGSPVVADGKVFIGAADQKIYALDAYNGSKIWEFMTNQPLNVEWGSTCAVYGGVVITGGDDGFVDGLVKDTGAKLWSVDVGPYINARDGLGQHNIRSSPVIYEGYAYVGSLNGDVYCINPLTGNVMWHVRAGNPDTAVVDPILGSAAFDKQGYVYFFSFTGRMSKINANPDAAQGGGSMIWNTAVATSAGSGFVFAANSYTPDVSLDGTELYYGAVRDQIMIRNTTDGTEILPRVPTQPHVLAENSHGSLIIVPGNLLSAVNQTLSSPTLPNGTIYSGYPITYVNTTAANPLVNGPQQGGYNYYKGQYTFGSSVDKIIGQAGPTIFCATMEEVNTTASRSSIGEPGGGSVQVRLAEKGDNIWSDWGGWEVWSSPIMASFGDNALIFYGSESYAVHCVNASNGVPLTWWTTNGPMGASQAVYDGKLYATSAEGKVYCFEEHDFTQTTTTASVDNTSPNAGQEVNVTVKLTSVPTFNVYEEIGQSAPIPSIPSQALIVTFIKPDGTTVVDVPATTDEYGNAVVSYTPDVAGDWQVVAAYNGIMSARETYAKSASDVIALTVGGSSATETPSNTESPTGTASPTSAATASPTVAPSSTGNNPTDYTLLYAGIAVVVIVVIVLAALVLMRRKK